jgi:hypothetical protein
MKKFLASTLLILCMGLPLTINADSSDPEEQAVEDTLLSESPDISVSGSEQGSEQGSEGSEQDPEDSSEDAE